MSDLNIAAAYIRVSTEDQTEYSPDSQIKMIHEYAKRNNYIVPDEYIFEDAGISGRTAKKRPEFMRMISLAKEKPRLFDVILVWKFSRFARNQEESIVYKSLLKKSNNIDVISISEPVSDDVFGSLIERIIEWMDQFYSIRLSGEVKRGMNEKVSRGEPVSIPAYGYDIINKQYVPNENADTVRQVFASYLSGEGSFAIAKQLNAAGVLNSRGNTFDNRFIDYMLHNPVYIGKIRWSNDGKAASHGDYDNPNIIITDGHHEPLIDIETWNAVQGRLAKIKSHYPKYARKEQTAEWMLKGLCRCSSCGSTLCLSSLAEMSMQCHLYMKGKCKVSHSLKLTKANKLVIESMEKSIATGKFNFAPEALSKKDTTNWDRLIKAEQKKLERIKEAYYSGIDTAEEYKANKENIQQKISSIMAQQKKQTGITAPFDLAALSKRTSDVLNIIKKPDVMESVKNKALHTVVNKIVYNKTTSSLDIFYLMG